MIEIGKRLPYAHGIYAMNFLPSSQVNFCLKIQQPLFLKLVLLFYVGEILKALNLSTIRSTTVFNYPSNSTGLFKWIRYIIVVQNCSERCNSME